MTNHPTPATHGQFHVHREAWAALPFFVNRTLDPTAQAAVETHITDCAVCRAEVEMLRRVERGVRDVAVETSQVDHAWRRLAAERAIAPPWARWSGLVAWCHDVLSETPGPARVALAAQTALLVVVVGTLALPDGPATSEASYQTLSAATTVALPAEAFLRVRFADEATDARLRGLLLDAGLKIVDGPSAAGLYALALAARGVDQTGALTRLRAATDAVRLIEVLIGTARPDADVVRP